MFDIDEVKDIAERSPTSKAIFNELSTRKRSRHRINLRKFRYDLLTKGQHIEEGAYLETFKQLQSAGVGRIISGRLGKPSRFVWNYKLVEVAKAASGAEPPQETRKPRKKVPIIHSTKAVAPISITFNLSPNIRAEDLGALISLVKELESKS